ncbi:hypothetical protein PoB_000099700 [Plakobranchus ocellatus]|uniref:Uncharacterized protein n=1 Tax=Plakobranchus ocellatus TaxID=259542 RepID=A0AAV3XVG3_9GAST|nr:hypothetical protein PoB_000099700 [Plakobranchus ocellatus]
MKAPDLLIWFVFISKVTAQNDKCGAEVLDCEADWNQKTGTLSDPEKRCEQAQKYRECVRKVMQQKPCVGVGIPLALDMEENLQCNMPDSIPIGQTACQVAQSLCHLTWSTGVKTKTRASERCEAAHQWRDCLLDAMTQLRCEGCGVHNNRLHKELYVNCIGGLNINYGFLSSFVLTNLQSFQMSIIRGMSEKKQEKGHNSKSFDQINLKLTQIEVHSTISSQRNPRGDRCIFASVTAAN